MFKAIVLAALLAFSIASPAPEPKAKPGILAAAYTAPVVGAPVAYTSYASPVVSAAYSAPVVSTYHGVTPNVVAYSPPVLI